MGAAEGFAALGLLCFLGASVALTVLDLRHRRIPNRIVLPALVGMLALFAAAAVAHGLTTGEWLEESTTEVPQAGVSPVFWPPAMPTVPWLGETLGGAALAFSLAIAAWLARPGAFGGGDVKAAPLAGGALGFVAGWSAVLWGLFLAAVLLAVAAALSGLLSRRRSDVAEDPQARVSGGRHLALPFAPALFAGAWIILLIDAGSVVLATLSK